MPLFYLLFAFQAFSATNFITENAATEYKAELLEHIDRCFLKEIKDTTEDAAQTFMHAQKALKQNFSRANLTKTCICLETCQALSVYTQALNPRASMPAFQEILKRSSKKTLNAALIALDSYYKGELPQKALTLKKELEKKDTPSLWIEHQRDDSISPLLSHFLIIWAEKRNKMLATLRSCVNPKTHALDVATFLQKLKRAPLEIHHIEPQDCAPYVTDFLRHFLKTSNLITNSNFLVYCPPNSTLHTAITAVTSAFLLFNKEQKAFIPATDFAKYILRAFRACGGESSLWNQCQRALRSDPELYYLPSTLTKRQYLLTAGHPNRSRYDYFKKKYLTPYIDMQRSTFCDLDATLKSAESLLSEKCKATWAQCAKEYMINSTPPHKDSVALQFTWTHKVRSLRCEALLAISHAQGNNDQVLRKIFSFCTREDFSVVQDLAIKTNHTFAKHVLLHDMQLEHLDDAQIHSTWFLEKLTQTLQHYAKNAAPSKASKAQKH